MYDKGLSELQDLVRVVAFPLSDIAQEFLKIEGLQLGNSRFNQLQSAYENMNMIGDTLFQYVEHKAPVFGKKPDREVYMMVKAAIQNAEILADVAKSELELKRNL